MSTGTLWTQVLVKKCCEREIGMLSMIHRYKRGRTIDGHPHAKYLRWGEVLLCTVTGKSKYSENLPRLCKQWSWVPWLWDSSYFGIYEWTQRSTKGEEISSKKTTDSYSTSLPGHYVGLYMCVILQVTQYSSVNSHIIVKAVSRLGLLEHWIANKANEMRRWGEASERQCVWDQWW